MTLPLRFRCFALPVFLAVAVSLLNGCASSKVNLMPTQYPSTVKDWHGIDSVEFLKPLQLNDYSRLAVEPIDHSTTPLPPKEENTYVPVLRVMGKTDEILLAEIQRTLKGKLAVSNDKPDPAASGTLLLRTKLVEMEPGSQAARYWGGFGAGAAWVLIHGEVSDAKTGDLFLKFDQKRIGAMGAFGGSYNSLLTDCVVENGRDIGRLLGYFRMQ